MGTDWKTQDKYSSIHNITYSTEANEKEALQYSMEAKTLRK